MDLKREKYLLAAAVSLLTALVYLPGLRNDFINWDDDLYVYNNGNIRSLNLSFFKWAFTTFYTGNWHPLTWISHAVDYALWGADPFGHHLTSILLHSLNAFIVVLVVARLMEAALLPQPDRRYTLIAAGMTGVLFGVHPVHVESVAWVAERKDVLCAFVFLICILLYVSDAAGRKEKPKERPWISRSYLSVLGFFCLSVLSKPMAITLPVVLLILDWFPFKRISSLSSLRDVIIEKVPLFALSFFLAGVTVLAQGVSNTLQPPFLLRLAVSADSLVAYLCKMVMPINLLPFYPYPRSLMQYATFDFALKVVLLLTGLITLRSSINGKYRFWSAGSFYYFITLFPALGLAIHVGEQSMADRYMYLPSLGPFLFAGLASAWAWEKSDFLGRWGAVVKPLIAAAGIFVIMSLSYLTLAQIAVWKNSLNFWSYIISKEPDRIPFAYNNRGLVFRDMGQPVHAIDDLNRAISLAPDYANAYNSRGLVFRDMGYVERAMRDFDRAIELDPVRYTAFNNRGMVYQEAGQPERAIKDFTAALGLNPDFSPAYVNRAQSYELTGRTDLAFEDYSSAIRSDPSFSNAYNNRGLLFRGAGMLDRALEDLNASVRLNPRGVDAYNNRGLVFEDLGRFDLALADYSMALKLRPDDYLVYNNRGIVYSRMGRRDSALLDFQKACDLGSKAGCEALQIGEVIKGE